MAGSNNRGILTPNINSPSTTTPTNQDLAFDPNGPGQLGAALRDPTAAWLAYSAAMAADQMRDKRYPGLQTQSNEADAYRHATWSYLMGRTIGNERAKSMGDAHEIDGLKSWPGMNPNSSGERAMDLHNNLVGRNLPGGGETQIQNAIRKGYVRMKPFPEK